MSDHIVSAFDQELKELNQRIAEMGVLAVKMVSDSIIALMRNDNILADRVIARDVDLNRMHQQSEERGIQVIARRQPMARDLREVFAAIKISSEIERIGDLAKNIANRVVTVSARGEHKSMLAGVERIGDLVVDHVNNAMRCCAQHDADDALEVWKNDQEIDVLYTSFFREMLTYMMEDPRNIGICTHLLFCAKDLERIADHATSIAEMVHFFVTGQSIKAVLAERGE
jgi:phosphate transport system protein